MAEEIVLKVDLEGDVRRFRVTLPPGGSDAERCDVLEATIRDGFKLPEGSPGLVLKYKDEEDDLCTLVEATLADFLLQGTGAPLRLFASMSGAPAPVRPAAPPRPKPPPPASAPFGLNPEAPAFVQGASPQDSGPPVEVLANAVAQALTGSMPSAAFSGPGPGREGAGLPEGFTGPSFMPSIASQGCRSVGPQKLLACLAGLYHTDLLSSRMISSLVLQFLPILAQRAHRKQEKMNRIGGQHREMVLPMLKIALAGADSISELQVGVKPLLEEFISGADDSKLGDCIAALLKALANAPDRESVAALIRGAGAELLALLPQAIPDVFSWDGGLAMGVAEHTGVKCDNCGMNPILGPLFSKAVVDGDPGMRLCGECFAFHTFEAGEKFDCHFMPEGVKGLFKGKGKEKGHKGPKAKSWKADKGLGAEPWAAPDGAQDASEVPGAGYAISAPHLGSTVEQEESQAAQGPVLMLQGGKSWPKGKGRQKGKAGKWKSKWGGGGGQETAEALPPDPVPGWGFDAYWGWAPVAAPGYSM